ncbi:hypothetical protein PanWU01x14_359810 [Parasponia andersonii]|uniref:Uncharacterized protein n=1 Tax=Parasponia andersonii TaxID=3476 RepID=A0A2P5A7U3_PARAD|nr:hypothetical protein PanWU01x14_359810 [Parasponia andersonii]
MPIHTNTKFQYGLQLKDFLGPPAVVFEISAHADSELQCCDICFCAEEYVCACDDINSNSCRDCRCKLQLR